MERLSSLPRCTDSPGTESRVAQGSHYNRWQLHVAVMTAASRPPVGLGDILAGSAAPNHRPRGPRPEKKVGPPGELTVST